MTADPALYDRLEQLAAEATPGPWATYEEHGRDISDEGWSLLAIRSMTGTLPDVALTHPLWGSENEQAREDAALIVALVNAAPHLIAAARRATDLEQRVRALAEELSAEAMTAQHIERAVVALRLYDALRGERYALEDVAREFGVDLDAEDGETP